MEYKVIDREHQADINIKNEPFSLFGRLVPSYDGEKWTYTRTMLPESEVSSMRFPDENYNFDEMASDHVFIGAYDGENCVGLAIMADDMFKYMCLDDLKVNGAYRGKGIGMGLVQKALEVAGERGYIGIYAIGQDNNLGACDFYLSHGFEIGGFDNRSYRGTSQAEKANIFFYLDK